MMFLTYFGFFVLCLHPTSALEIKHLTLFTDELEINSPSRLLIPCFFYTHSHLYSNQLLLEWGMTPENSDSYKPILRLYDTLLEPLPNANERAQIFVSLVPAGNCSLVINPTYVNDSGTYEVHLTVNGSQYTPVPVINIRVREGKKSSAYAPRGAYLQEEMSKVDSATEAINDDPVYRVMEDDEQVEGTENTVTEEGDIEERKQTNTACDDLDPETISFAEAVMKLNKAHVLTFLIVVFVLVIFVLCIGTIAGAFTGPYFYQLLKVTLFSNNGMGPYHAEMGDGDAGDDMAEEEEEEMVEEKVKPFKKGNVKADKSKEEIQEEEEEEEEEEDFPPSAFPKIHSISNMLNLPPKASASAQRQSRYIHK